MASTFNYPPLRAGLLQSLVALKREYDSDPDFLNNSPYDNEAKAVLAALFEPKIIETVKEVEVVKEVKAGRGRPTKDIALSEEDQEAVRSNIADLIQQLNQLGTGEGLDTNERIQIIKTKAGLNEQLLKMQERIFNVKRMSDYQSVVISILDDLVSEKDRNLFLKRLEPYRE